MAQKAELLLIYPYWFGQFFSDCRPQNTNRDWIKLEETKFKLNSYKKKKQYHNFINKCNKEKTVLTNSMSEFTSIIILPGYCVVKFQNK
jgi:hypothetical protein